MTSPSTAILQRSSDGISFPTTTQLCRLSRRLASSQLALLPVPSVLFCLATSAIALADAQVLLLSIVVMAAPTTLVGLIPTYAEIGVLAPVLLIVLRLAQGLSVGGEMTGSITFMVESAPPNRRGFAGSWVYVGVGVGFLLGSAVGIARDRLAR